MKKAGMISLGCSKNRVDSEMMLHILRADGWQITADESDADIIIINTCGFIEDAKKEAIEVIFDMARYKDEGKLQKLIVTGCFGQRYADDILSDMPEVDGIIGVFQYKSFLRHLEAILRGERAAYIGEGEPLEITGERVLTTPPYMAYIRIADGCDNFCSYCAIPYIRGRYISRPADSIIAEAKALCARGVKELIIVAQDTTRYGSDIYGEPKLAWLLRRLLDETDAPWIRVLYCYPELVTPELIALFASEKRICSYMDIPIQHISDKILKSMNRRSTGADIRKMLAIADDADCRLALRTSLIAGFPGEGEEEHKELLSFVSEGHFMHAGVFAYSQEEGTAAAKMKMVPKKLRLARLDELMAAQSAVSLKKHQSFVGTELNVLVEGNEKGRAYGRTEYQAPDTDGIIYLDKPAPVGGFVRARITAASHYDWTGDII